MTNDLQPLIDQVEADSHSHVIVMIDPRGIRWRGESESACALMAKIVGNAKVLMRSQFLTALRQIQDEQRTPNDLP